LFIGAVLIALLVERFSCLYSEEFLCTVLTEASQIRKIGQDLLTVWIHPVFLQSNL